MGKCEICGKKILYNKYKRYRKQILCRECYDTRSERKAAKKAALKAQAESLKIVTPKKKAKKDMENMGIENEGTPKFYGEDDEDETTKAEDSA